MKPVADHPHEPERPRSLEELRRRLNRRVSDFREGWKRCDKPPCRRRKQCCGEGPDFKCTDDGTPQRTPSPEQTAKAMSDLYKEVKRRCAERAAGAEPAQQETPSKLRDQPRAPTRRRRRSAQSRAATMAGRPPPADGAEAQSPIAEATPLAPEKMQRIERACNDDGAAQPAQQDGTRERRPRITQL